jgi:DnaJ-class molecular chaperone
LILCDADNVTQKTDKSTFSPASGALGQTLSSPASQPEAGLSSVMKTETKQIQPLAGNDRAGWYVQWQGGAGFRSAMPDRETAILVSVVPELLEVCKALARLGIERCPRCDGTGRREHGAVVEACGQCGGTGEETFNPHPDEIRAARAALSKAESTTP